MPDEWDRPDDEDDAERELQPGDTDYELSEEYGWDWEPTKRPAWPVPPWAMVAVSILLVLALVVPSLVLIARR
jgi:hypothetical protein